MEETWRKSNMWHLCLWNVQSKTPARNGVCWSNASHHQWGCGVQARGAGGWGGLLRGNRAGVRTRGFVSCRTIKVGAADAQTKPRVKVCVSRRGVQAAVGAQQPAAAVGLRGHVQPLGVWSACDSRGSGTLLRPCFPGREGVKHGTHLRSADDPDTRLTHRNTVCVCLCGRLSVGPCCWLAEEPDWDQQGTAPPNGTPSGSLRLDSLTGSSSTAEPALTLGEWNF